MFVLISIRNRLGKPRQNLFGLGFPLPVRVTRQANLWRVLLAPRASLTDSLSDRL